MEKSTLTLIFESLKIIGLLLGSPPESLRFRLSDTSLKSVVRILTVIQKFQNISIFKLFSSRLLQKETQLAPKIQKRVRYRNCS